MNALKISAAAGMLTLSLALVACGARTPVSGAENSSNAESNPSAEVADAVPDNTEPQSSDEDYVIELDPQYNVPTEELLKSFPITYQTPAETEFSKKIQNRMLNGFNRWNMGYEAWEHWGEALYHEDSIYNVNGVRLTLAEYQQAMNVSLKNMNIQMGNFNNMILSGDWMAIRYDIINTDRDTGEVRYGTTMEFARFGDYGELGAKVDEGWGGVKNSSYSGTMHFQTPEEQETQNQFMQDIINTVLPETDDLEVKYPVIYATPIETEIGVKIKAALLEDFEHWNGGYEDWANWADTFFDSGVTYNLLGEDLNLDALKKVVADTIDTYK